MFTPSSDEANANEVAILSRVLVNGKEPLSPELARYFLGLGFTDQEKGRMHDLAVKNQAGDLSSPERAELLAYAKAGCLLGILHSRARQYGLFSSDSGKNS